MYAYHNSHVLKYRTPFGAAEVQTQISLCLDLYEAPQGVSCFIRVWEDHAGEALFPMEEIDGENGLRFRGSFDLPGYGCLCWYYFQIRMPDGSFFYYGNNDLRLGGEGKLQNVQPESYQITVYEHAPVPDWYKEGIVYQIFPDRFARDSHWLNRQKTAARPEHWKGPRRLIVQDWNDPPFYTKNGKGEVTRWPFWGGSLAGIREKIPYLKSMHVSVLYLNPIFRATSNHKYDTANYMEIDPSFGTEQDFISLASDCHKAGIRLILDGVFSHTGADSMYFNQQGNYDTVGACQSTSSPYYSWYRFERYPVKYESWWGVGDLPNVEETNPDYQEYIFGGRDSVIRHWLKAGADGWRLDVADELPDSFIVGLRAAMKETKPDAVLMGEVWEDASNKKSYGETREYFLGRELDCTMHYPFRSGALDFMMGKVSASLLAAQMMSIKENYPIENFYGCLNLIGSHDRARVLTVLGGMPDGMNDIQKADYRLTGEQRFLAARRLKALSMLQFTAAGVPCIYYGDEAGCEGCEDPYNRGTYPWGNEDTDLLTHYQKLTHLRSTDDVLKLGDFLPLAFGDNVYGCIRTYKNQSVLTLVNRSLRSSEYASLPVSGHSVHIAALMGTNRPARNGDRLVMTLSPLETIMCRITHLD